MIMNTVILMISNTQAISMLTFMTSIMNTMLNNNMLEIGVANGSGLATTMRLMRHKHLNMNPPSIMKLKKGKTLEKVSCLKKMMIPLSIMMTSLNDMRTSQSKCTLRKGHGEQ